MEDDLSCGEDFNFNDPSVNNTEGANVSFSQDAAPVGCTETPVAMSKNANANKVMDEVGVLSERLNMNNPLTLEHKSDVNMGGEICGSSNPIQTTQTSDNKGASIYGSTNLVQQRSGFWL
ncbi:hypothetical protein JHK82_022231 [Glycine max]|nr:hypothetical protein JHK85_022718 [Glycine max]KAG5137500.1 hypothetical protein JHK82_022231 [Glycine max]